MAMGSGSPLDSDAIKAATNEFVDRLQDCVHDVNYQNTRNGPYVNTPNSPRKSRITVAPGIRQRAGYVDIQWWQNKDYKYHYQEDGLEFRFGREADKRQTQHPVKHFHPPQNPGQHTSSCIKVEWPPELVTLAVIANWLPAARRSDPSVLNARQNPP